jgi:23S rRNA pseudouridine1911/1915/1917 synthase
MSHTDNAQNTQNYNVKLDPSAVTDCNEKIIELKAPKEIAGLRLDQALAHLFPQWSRSRLQGWIKQDRVSVDGSTGTSRQKMWGGETIRILPGRIETDHPYQAEAIPLNIIYEDNHLLVLNKPADLVVHPGNGNWQGTLLNALLNHAPQLSHVPRAGIVHRLDKATTGLLVVAKTIEAQLDLVRQLQQRTVKRYYLALVLGEVRKDGLVDAPIGRHPILRTRMAVTQRGKSARTYYQVLERLPACTLLRCSLETGRTHQIRVHLCAIGHPLVGDPVYGKKSIDPSLADIIPPFPRQALHAQKLELIHPHSKQPMIWEAPLPDDMAKLLQAVRTTFPPISTLS